MRKQKRNLNKMIDYSINANTKLCEYNLEDFDGNVLGTAKLTKLEAQIKNFAFGLNGCETRYRLVHCDVKSEDESTTIIVLPD